MPGLVPTRDFDGSLADRRFQSTQYMRNHSVPFYTPEIDIVHEIVGHANMLASPVLADLYEVAGRGSLRCGTAEGERMHRSRLAVMTSTERSDAAVEGPTLPLNAGSGRYTNMCSPGCRRPGYEDTHFVVHYARRLMARG